MHTQGFELCTNVPYARDAPDATGVRMGICIGTPAADNTLPCKPNFSVAFTGHTADTPVSKQFSTVTSLISGTWVCGWTDPLALGPLTTTAPLQQHMAGGELRVRVRVTEVDGMQL